LLHVPPTHVTLEPLFLYPFQGLYNRFFYGL
jgi:hypothetical protein